MAMVTVYVPNVLQIDKPIYIKKGNLYYQTPFFTNSQIHVDPMNWRCKSYYLFLEDFIELALKKWAKILFRRGCPKPVCTRKLGLVFVKTRLTINTKQEPASVSYSVQGIYKGYGQEWCNWMSNLTLKEAKDLIKSGNDFTTSLRIVKVTAVVVS